MGTSITLLTDRCADHVNRLTPICRSDWEHNPYDNETCWYDASIPEARAALWRSVNATLVKNGIHMFWLDGDEVRHCTAP